jgi:hypothetical protein
MRGVIACLKRGDLDRGLPLNIEVCYSFAISYLLDPPELRLGSANKP